MASERAGDGQYDGDYIIIVVVVCTIRHIMIIPTLGLYCNNIQWNFHDVYLRSVIIIIILLCIVEHKLKNINNNWNMFLNVVFLFIIGILYI